MVQKVAPKTEGPEALQARTLYRQLGPTRSYRTVAEQLGKSETLIARWASGFNWVEDARQYDLQIAAEAEARNRKQRIQEMEQRRRRRLQIADVTQTKVGAGVLLLDPQALADDPMKLVALMRQANQDQRIDEDPDRERSEHNITIYLQQLHAVLREPDLPVIDQEPA